MPRAMTSASCGTLEYDIWERKSRVSRPCGSMTNVAGVWSIAPCTTAAAIPYACQTRFSCGSEPVRKSHLCSIPCACE